MANIVKKVFVVSVLYFAPGELGMRALILFESAVGAAGTKCRNSLAESDQAFNNLLSHGLLPHRERWDPKNSPQAMPPPLCLLDRFFAMTT
jgi:hypothetical protein